MDEARRLLTMNRQRTALWITLSLLLAVSLAGCVSAPGKGPVLAATINRDCGPADGPAFTVTAPWGEGGQVIVSIWQAPDISRRTTFTLSDPTDQTGSATLFTAKDALEPLSGTVTFEAVSSERPVEGSFRFVTGAGEVVEGSFTAQWIESQAMCG